MTESIIPVNVKIFDREYQIACPESEQSALSRAARKVTEQMNEVRSGSQNASTEQVAVLSALNIAHEHLQEGRGDSAEQRATAARLQKLRRRADKVLQQYRQVEL